MRILAQLNIPTNSTQFNNYQTLPGDVVSRVLLYAIAFSGMLFFVKLIYSGFLFLTSIGDPQKIQASSKNLLNSLLGLFLVVTAFFLAQIIFAILGLNASFT